MRHTSGMIGTVLIGLLASVLQGTGAESSPSGEHVCVSAVRASYADETIACYSDAGCARAARMGGEPVRDYDQASAPFALARGKIAAVVTSSPRLMKAIAKAGGRCAPALR